MLFPISRLLRQLTRIITGLSFTQSDISSLEFPIQLGALLAPLNEFVFYQTTVIILTLVCLKCMCIYRQDLSCIYDRISKLKNQLMASEITLISDHRRLDKHRISKYIIAHFGTYSMCRTYKTNIYRNIIKKGYFGYVILREKGDI